MSCHDPSMPDSPSDVAYESHSLVGLSMLPVGCAVFDGPEAIKKSPNTWVSTWKFLIDALEPSLYPISGSALVGLVMPPPVVPPPPEDRFDPPLSSKRANGARNTNGFIIYPFLIKSSRLS